MAEGGEGQEARCGWGRWSWDRPGDGDRKASRSAAPPGARKPDRWTPPCESAELNVCGGTLALAVIPGLRSPCGPYTAGRPPLAGLQAGPPSLSVPLVYTGLTPPGATVRLPPNSALRGSPLPSLLTLETQKPTE